MEASQAGSGAPEQPPRVDVGPDQHLTYVLAKVAHLLERRLDQALASDCGGLTLRQFSALVHIARSPGLTTADLARALLTSPQAVGTLVQRLRSAGLIERTTSRAGRSVGLALSPQGLDALTDAAPLATATEAAVLTELDTDELATTERTLRRLLDRLGDQPPQAADPPDTARYREPPASDGLRI